MFSVKSSLVALTLVASALASHIDVSRRHHQHVGRSNGTDVSERSLGKRKSGKFSFYNPEEVACGGHSTYNGRTFAWPLSDWGSGRCGTKVSITVNGKTEVGTCTDQCVGCPGDQLDLTPGWFSFFGPQSEGILHGEWHIVGEGGGDDNDGGDDGGNKGGNDGGKKKQDNNDDDEEQKKKEAAEKKKKEEEEERAKKEKAEKEAKAKEEAAKAKAAAEAKEKASISSKSVASVASVAKASAAAVASASSAAAAAAAQASIQAAASPDPDTAEPTEAPQAVGASSSFGSNGAAALHVTIPTMLFSALLGVAAVAL